MPLVKVVLRDDEAAVVAVLTIAQLPDRAEARDASGDGHRGRSMPNVELCEGSAYRYVIEGSGPVADLQPRELFDADDISLISGRLNTGEAVGIVTVEVTDINGRRGTGRFDVRASKVTDEDAFQSMLRDLTEVSVEALHQGFAASSGSFSSANGPAPRLLYQRFALLHAFLFDRDLDWALGHILADPHRAWVTEMEPRRVGEPIRSSAGLARSLTGPGRRVVSPAGPLETLPWDLASERSTDTLDTVPNRYVRFILEAWRRLAEDALVAAHTLGGPPLRRGVGQAERTINRLDELLAEPLFRQVSPLSVYPRANPVLLRREGYRQVAAAASVIESSLGLELDLEDPFLVSRRSIATLYEHWCFVRLALAVARICGAKVDADLFDPSRNGMSLVLRSGKVHGLTFKIARHGAPLELDLYFNRTFTVESWTRQMRPDASLRVHSPGETIGDYWLHFDAKYKIERTPFEQGDVALEEATENLGGSKRTDLLKMHAYRDAIRHSAASYVLFPGSDQVIFRFAETEALPAVGAFPLRPDHVVEDGARLESLIDGVVSHVANAATRHRRAQYWTQAAYNDASPDGLVLPLDSLSRPPADTLILCGYVRSREHLQWIVQHGRYNLRTGDRSGAVSFEGAELDARLVLLYEVSGKVPGLPRLLVRKSPWRGVDVQTLRRLGYPRPQGQAYFVADVEPLARQPTWVQHVLPNGLRPQHPHTFGAPFVASWQDLASSAEAP